MLTLCYIYHTLIGDAAKTIASLLVRSRLDCANAALIGMLSKNITTVADCIVSKKFSFFAAVETWHDSADCPSVIACTPSGYLCIEQARSRSSKSALSMKTNHGGCVSSTEHATQSAVSSYRSTGRWSC